MKCIYIYFVLQLGATDWDTQCVNAFFSALALWTIWNVFSGYIWEQRPNMLAVMNTYVVLWQKEANKILIFCHLDIYVKA